MWWLFMSTVPENVHGGSQGIVRKDASASQWRSSGCMKQGTDPFGADEVFRVVEALDDSMYEL